MALRSKDVVKWSRGEWLSKVKYAAPSKGGAVGVVFCWCQNPGSNGPNYGNPGTADFVIKPADGSAAPAKFAEHFLKKVVGATTVHTEPIVKKDEPAKFQAILQAIERSKLDLEVSEQTELKNKWNNIVLPSNLKGNRHAKVAITSARYKMDDKSKERLARWRQVWPNYAGADAFLIQDMAESMTELGDEYKETGVGRGIRSVLQNEQLMRNIGCLFAADAVLGNGDRLCQLNPGNVLFNQKTGGVFAIDSQTILTNFNEVMTTAKQERYMFFPTTPTAWANGIATNAFTQVPTGKKVNEEKPVLAPDFTMNMFYQRDKWFDNVFRGGLQNDFSVKHGLVSQDPPQEQDWQQAKQWFLQGVTQGLNDVDSRLSGFNWLLIKQKFASYSKKYGADANMDWTNFKLRRIYIKAVRAGLSEEQALELVEKYAKRKLPITDDSV